MVSLESQLNFLSEQPKLFTNSFWNVRRVLSLLYNQWYLHMITDYWRVIAEVQISSLNKFDDSWSIDRFKPGYYSYPPIVSA